MRRAEIGTAPPVRTRPATTVRPAPAEPAPARPDAKAGVLEILAGTLGGVAISVAWWFPGTVASALLGWVAAALLVFAVRARRAYLPAYCAGLACYSLGFYWIFSTVAVFGGFGTVAAGLVFLLYVSMSAVQFLAFAFIHHHLGARCDAFALRAPIALVLSEFASIRLFQWHYGHTQIAFRPFVQVADIGGALLISFLMFWLVEAGVRAIVFRERKWSFLLPVVACVLSLDYGLARIRTFDTRLGQQQDVILVQGNSPIPKFFEDDVVKREVTRLYELSRAVARRNALIVWAEGAIPAFIPADLGSVRTEPVLPCFGDGSAFLLGAYAFDRQERRYNAAFAVQPDGTVPWPYFKRVLIPFGEYMPFSSWFPWLKELNGKAGLFTAGTRPTRFDYPMRDSDGTPYSLKVAPLICYEDTVPGLSREAARGGAELLVNLTYDTWFGRSVAADEHHLIAAFRAIETRRYLVRATNSGLSAVVDPVGRTTARIPSFTEGTSSARVKLLKDRTLYAEFLGDRPWWILLVATLAAIGTRLWRRDDRPQAA